MALTSVVQVFAIGVGVLAVAILVNALAVAAGLTTWYAFIAAIQDEGLWPAILHERIPTLFFLFLLYPFILGLTAYGLTRWLT